MDWPVTPRNLFSNRDGTLSEAPFAGRTWSAHAERQLLALARLDQTGQEAAARPSGKSIPS